MIIRRPFSAVLLATLALCTACEVGDPLVDRLSPRQSGPIKKAACEVPQPCDEAPVPQLVFNESKPLKWQGCPLTCEGTSGGNAGNSLSLECIPLDPLQELAADLSCVTKRFTASATAPALAAGAGLHVSNVRWNSSNVVIEGRDPLEIVIAGSELRDTRVDLVGPITLRFQDGTSLTSVSISSATKTARVVLDGVDPSGLIVGDAALPFAGHVEASHNSWSSVSIVVQTAELDSVMVSESFISARELVANDGALSAVTLDVGHGTFAPAVLEGVEFSKCETLSFFGSKLKRVLVPRCSGEPTRIYESNVAGGRLDGRVSGDGSTLEGVHLGVNDPSELELWGVKVSGSTFCDHVDSLKVSYNALTCSTCSEGAFEPLEKGCLLPLGEFEDLASFEAEENDAGLKSNFCAALDMFEPCRPPVPMRTRPIGVLD